MLNVQILPRIFAEVGDVDVSEHNTGLQPPSNCILCADLPCAGLGNWA